MVVYGYVRNERAFPLNEQLKIINDYKCQEIFIEDQESHDQETLERLIHQLNSADVIVIASLTILGEEVSDIIRIFERLRRKKVQIISWTSHLHLNYYKRLKGLL